MASPERALTLAYDASANIAPNGNLGRQFFSLYTMISGMAADLPVGHIEPVVISVKREVGAIGTVIAPAGVLARHVVVRGTPKHAQPGQFLRAGSIS
jgi:hypothetical protein